MRASILIVVVKISDEKTEERYFFDQTIIEFMQTTNADDTPATIRRAKLSNRYFKYIFFLPLKFFVPYFLAILDFSGIAF